MKTEGNHLTLQVQQKTEETEEGYKEDICHGIVLLNDGENELTEVELYLDGDMGFSLDPADEKISENTLAPGEKWNAVLKMKPGKKAGKYYVTVVACAAELQETVEQTIRFVVREGETPEVIETPEPVETAETTETPKPDETPNPVETPEANEPPEEIETPKPAETSEANEPLEETETLNPAETPEPNETPGQVATAETPNPSGIPEPMGAPELPEKPEGMLVVPEEVTGVQTAAPVTPTGSESTDAIGTVPSEVPPLPQPSAKTETGKENLDAQSSVPATENDEIIRVTLPGHVSMKMNPFTSDKNSQITSGQFPITNESGFPLDVEVTKAVVDVRQNAGFTCKDCSLGIDFLRNDAVVLAVRNLREGVNQIHTSFLLPSGDTTYFRIFGSVDEGTESLWEDSDLQASIVFRFSAGNNS